jgi:hypothetical protein
MFAAKDRHVVAAALLVAIAVAVALMISWGVGVSGEVLALSVVAAVLPMCSPRAEVRPVRVEKTRSPRSPLDL